MMNEIDMAGAFDSLALAEKAVDRLHKMCCEPGRSPRLLEVSSDLAAVRASLEAFDGNADSADQIVGHLADVGSRIGSLQVECCAPARMPLYADTLGGLTEVQLAVNAAAGQGH